MKRQVVFGALGGLAVSVALVGVIGPNVAFGTVLDGFSINTQDKAVTVTLYTDQRASYTTENQGRQFTIILPETQLSQQQMDNGLPVVVDNKNRFIGRAVPTTDGKVKIILPNLPVSEYAVSVQQQRPGQTTVARSAEAIKPRSIAKPSADNHFEQLASAIAKPHAAKASSHTQSSSQDNAVDADATLLQATRLENRSAAAESEPPKASRGTIWNPYVVKRPTATGRRPIYTVTRRPTRPSAPVSSSAVEDASTGLDETALGKTANDALSSFSSETDGASSERGTHSLFPKRLGLTSTLPAATPPLKDPLWYLHALPPANMNAAAPELLQGPALAPVSDPMSPASLQALAAAKASKVTTGNVTAPAEPLSKKAASFSTKLKNALMSWPSWLLVALALFLGGIGLFGVIGALVMLRLLFSQLRPMAYSSGMVQQPVFTYPGTMPYAGLPMMNEMETPRAPASLQFSDVTQYPQRASRPVRPAYSTSDVVDPVAADSSAISFADTVSVSALDYLRKAPTSVSDAVHNATLLKFPASKSSGTKAPARPSPGHRLSGRAY